MTDDLTIERVCAAYERARDDLLAERNDRGHWTGELSTSALSTATAVMALEMVRRHSSTHHSPLTTHLTSLIDAGLAWLADHQNDDGGWGDTTKSFSNISTTMLCHAVLHATRQRWTASTPAAQSSRSAYDAATERAKSYIERAGGVPTLVARYGKDKTFSVPILTHCALAGLVDWREVQQLPFELACVPPRFYKTVRLPVVSYALPALIAIGQVRHYFRPTRVPGLRWLRNRAKRRSLDVLEQIQPSSGGFLEAAPLTSFVTMSLAGMGLVEHPVVRKGVEFIVDSVRDDGSWPIDTNLATWVTTLSVNALSPDLPDDARTPILRWLLDQQYKEVHPYTSADPGGWAWTDLPGGVPDADDTAGAILAILELVRGQGAGVRGQESEDMFSREASPSVEREEDGDERLRFSSADFRTTPAKPQATPNAESQPNDSRLPDNLVREAHEAVRRGVQWLLDLQNRDGGWPTFCRGWGKLPFDRSSPDITAHVARALLSCEINGRTVFDRSWQNESDLTVEEGRCFHARNKCWTFLRSTHEIDGSWLPLWFGNQSASNEQNRTYGTSRVLTYDRSLTIVRVHLLPSLGVIGGAGRFPEVGRHRRSLNWFLRTQNPDGGWGGDVGCPSSVEETSLAVEVLLSDPSESSQLAARRGLLWLIKRVEDGTYREPTPIGFYFAKLWYFERLYPLIFTVAALRRACEVQAEEETS